MVFSFSHENLLEILKKNELDLSLSIEDIADKLNSPIIMDHIAHLKEQEKLNKDYKVLKVGSFSKLDVSEGNKNNLNFYLDSDGLSLQERKVLNGELAWDNEDPRYRLKNLAKYLALNDSEELRENIMKLFRSLKEAIYLGKNLSYYIIASTTDTNLMMWVFKNIGNPSSNYGMNIKDLFSVRSFYNPEIQKNIEILNKMLPEMVVDQEISRILQHYSKP